MNDEQRSVVPAGGRWLSCDLLAIVLASASVFVLAPVAGALVVRFSTPDLWYGSDFSVLYWIRWGARLVGRWPFDLLAGILLGAWLRRISPWHVWLAVVAILCAVVAGNRGFLGVDDGRWVAQVGPGWAALQLMVQIAAILGMTAVGIWMGRRSQQRGVADLRQTPAGPTMRA